MRLSTLGRLGALLAVAVLALPAQAQSYTQASITGTYTDLGTTGTAGPVGDDVLSAGITFPSGFTFSYYGTPRAAFRINTNGWIDFNVSGTPTTFTGTPTASQARTNTGLPATSLPNSTVAPFWDDLNITGSGATRYVVVAGATAADDRLVVQWKQAVKFGVATDNLNFQVWLFRDGRIQFHYGVMTAEGTSFSTGVENDGGTLGTQVFFNPATAPVLDNTGYSFTYVPPAPVAASFSSTTTAFQNTATFFQNEEAYVIGANVVVGGNTGTIPLTSISFTTTGTTNTADLARARLVYTGSSTSFNLGTAPVFGSPIVSPSGTLTFTGSQALSPGNNYFFLIYQAAAGATPGNLATRPTRARSLTG